MGAVLFMSAALALVAAACGGPGKKAAAHGTSAATTTAPAPTTTTRHIARRGDTCPLTGTPPPNKQDLTRTALAVKVENLPQARPQWGLDHADIVYEEPVEGGITRFIAVYQCHGAPRIEPVRSARLLDVQILRPLGRLLFSYSGAIQPVVDKVDAPGTLLWDVGGYKAPGAYHVDPTRYAPHNFTTSTNALYTAAKSLGYPLDQPPLPQFSYGRTAKGAKPAAAVAIHFPLDVTTWTWDPKTRLYLRSYSDTGPGVQGDGTQISAKNVVLIWATEYATQYVEDPTGAHENDMVLNGKGPAWVVHDGAVFQGTWVRPSLAGPAVFIGPGGEHIKLDPGNTWEELLPTGTKVVLNP